MNKKLRESLDKMALIAGFALMLGFMDEGFRTFLGESMNRLFEPLIGMLPLYMVIFVLSAITGLYTSLIQKYTIDWEKNREAMERMKSFQKEFREAQLSKNKHKLKKLEKQKNQMMEIQGEMMRQQFKPMAYIILASMPIFGWLYYLIFTLDPAATIILPFYGKLYLATDTVLRFIPVWIFWYMLCSISVSQVIRKTLNVGGV